MGSARLMVTRRIAPIAAPQTVPLPPKIATPPMTTAATAWSSMPVPAPELTRAVAGGEDDAGEPGEGAAEHERADHAAPHVESVEDGGVRVGADRVELAPAAVRVEVVAHDDQRRASRR